MCAVRYSLRSIVYKTTITQQHKMKKKRIRCSWFCWIDSIYTRIWENMTEGASRECVIFENLCVCGRKKEEKRREREEREHNGFICSSWTKESMSTGRLHSSFSFIERKADTAYCLGVDERRAWINKNRIGKGFWCWQFENTYMGHRMCLFVCRDCTIFRCRLRWWYWNNENKLDP